MRTKSHSVRKARKREVAAAAHQMELQLPPPSVAAPKLPATASGGSPRVTGVDQLLSTRDVTRIIGRDRGTLWRWVRAGTFPPKHRVAGRTLGWRRSDVEAWLADGADRPK